MPTPVIASRDAANERRLELLRQEAQRVGLVRSPGIRPAGAPSPVPPAPPGASAENGYYGTPLLKEPTWFWSIPVYFFIGGAAGASAVAMLELQGHRSPALHRLGVATATVETIVGAILEGRTHRGLEPLKRGPSGWLTRLGGVLSGPVPLALRLFGRRFLAMRRAAAVSTLVGSLMTRFAWIEAGRQSAEDAAVPLHLDERTERAQATPAPVAADLPVGG